LAIEVGEEEMSNYTGLKLSTEEQAMLSGDQGTAVRRAMEIVVALAKIYGAGELVQVVSVQVAGVSYKNLGQAGLDFLREWAAQGARVRVPTTLNPAGMDTRQWRDLGFPEAFARNQQDVIAAYTAMGIQPTCTCTPYLVGNRPALGDHIAWAESSAVGFANSMLGARTNREGGPSALAAAICGRTAAYGLHLDAPRVAHFKVHVHPRLDTVSDWGALGYIVGRRVRNGVPYFYLHNDCVQAFDREDLTDGPAIDRFKALGAAMAASGAVALYHIAGVTPEARMADMLASDAESIVVRDLSEGYAALNGSASAWEAPTPVDLVSIGCPHASASEIRQVAEMLKGKRVRAALWITTARQVRQEMASEVACIEQAGGRVVADTCLVVAPMHELGCRRMATNSAKMAFYAPAHSGLDVRFGTLEQCICAAISGTWPAPPKLTKH
jgi:predicted aconitase